MHIFLFPNNQTQKLAAISFQHGWCSPVLFKRPI